MEKPIGEVLNQWKVYLTNISRNLMELSEQTDVKIIKSKANDASNGFTGITRAKAVNCTQCLEKLWQYYAVLSEAIEKANDLYSKNSFLNNTEDEVREILETASIVMETEHIAISKRNLLSSEKNEKRVTPRELLKYMEESFESLCTDIAEISKASETVQTRLSYMKIEIDKLNSKVKKLGIANLSTFDLRKVIELESDPFQGIVELDKLVYNIEKYRASIKSIEEEYNKIFETFNKVRGSLSELKGLASKSRSAVLESEKIFGATQNVKPVISEEVIKSLEDWLQTLESKLREGQIKAVKVGVSKLQLECSLKLHIERENYHENIKACNEWLDLKGVFKALLAKAEALRAKGLLSDRVLNELIDNTKAALYADTINLENCRQLVREFEIRLKK